MTRRSAQTQERYRLLLNKLDQSIGPVYVINELPSASGMVALRMAFFPDRRCYMPASYTLIARTPGMMVVKNFMET